MTRPSSSRREFLRSNAVFGATAFLAGTVSPGWSLFPYTARAPDRLTYEGTPRTLYSREDIRNARRNVDRHEWARDIVGDWKEEVAPLMERDRSTIRSVIPALTPGSEYGQTCPHCVNDRSGEGHADFQWTIERPDQIRCADCGTVYPNECYPETGILRCPRMGQSFSYYQPPGERQHPEQAVKYAFRWNDRPVQTSFSGVIRYNRVTWIRNRALDLAKLYAVTGKPRYAERAAWILERLAEVFPDYLYKSYDGTYADLEPGKVAANMGDPETPRGGRFEPEVIRHPYGLNQHGDYATLYNGFWGAGRMSPHGQGSDCGPLLDITIAYDLVREARRAGGQAICTEEIKSRITDDLIAAGCDDYEQWDELSNKGIATRPLSAGVGRLLKEPERVHRAHRGLTEVIATRYHFDGFYSETPGYAEGNYYNMRALPDLLVGYSDPPGYQPSDGERLENLDPYGTGDMYRMLLALVRHLAPGDRLPVIGDTHHNDPPRRFILEIITARLGPEYARLYERILDAEIREQGDEYALWFRPDDLAVPEQLVDLPYRSEWFPGWHVGVLRGRNAVQNKTALYLVGNEHDWTVETGHRQRDVLAASYYAFGRELASDQGYFSGSNQRLPDGRFGHEWTNGTVSHNLVVVDEEEQRDAAGTGSHLELFGAAPGVEVMQASGVNVYPQTDYYGRTMALVPLSGSGHYIVDFFRVTGGHTHQYNFHSKGSLVGVQPDGHELEHAELSPIWTKWLENPQGFTPTQSQILSWTYEDVHFDLTLLNTAQRGLDRLVVADAPGWRNSSQVVSEEAAEAIDPIPQLIAERKRAKEEDGEFASLFATVWVPHQGPASPVQDVRLVAHDQEAGMAAVAVELEGRTDYIISSQDQVRRAVGPCELAGEFGYVSVGPNGRPSQAYLLKGTHLSCDGMVLDVPQSSATLSVRSTEGRTFHLSDSIPAGFGTSGFYVLAEGPKPLRPGAPRPRTGYEIASVTESSLTVRDYPVVDCDRVVIPASRWWSDV